MAASTAMSVVGGIQQASAASANAAFQQKVAYSNAERAEKKIQDAKVRGADKEQQVLAEGANTVAKTRGALAANNMDLTFGSPLDTILDTSVAVQKDAYRTRRNTQYEVDDLTTEKYNYLNSASAYGAESANAKSAGFISGVGTALSGAASIYKYKASLQ